MVGRGGNRWPRPIVAVLAAASMPTERGLDRGAGRRPMPVPCRSADDAETEGDSACGLGHAGRFQRDRRAGHRVEQAEAVAKEDGPHPDPQLVHEPGLEALAHRQCAADDRDLLVARRRLGPSDCSVDAIGDEGERQVVVLPLATWSGARWVRTKIGTWNA